MSNKLVNCKNCGLPCIHVSIPAIQDSREEEDRGLCCNCLRSSVIGIEQCAQCEQNKKRITIRTDGDLAWLPDRPIIRFCCEKIIGESYLSEGEIPEDAESFFTVWLIGQVSRIETPYELMVCKSLTSKVIQRIASVWEKNVLLGRLEETQDAKEKA